MPEDCLTHLIFPQEPYINMNVINTLGLLNNLQDSGYKRRDSDPNGEFQSDKSLSSPGVYWLVKNQMLFHLLKTNKQKKPPRTLGFYLKPSQCLSLLNLYDIE